MNPGAALVGGALGVMVIGIVLLIWAAISGSLWTALRRRRAHEGANRVEKTAHDAMPAPLALAEGYGHGYGHTDHALDCARCSRPTLARCLTCREPLCPWHLEVHTGDDGVPLGLRVGPGVP